jgi:hypothetical protein
MRHEALQPIEPEHSNGSIKVHSVPKTRAEVRTFTR